MVWAPTGAGKTHVFAHVLSKLMREKRVAGKGFRAVLLTKTVPLALQLKARLRGMGEELRAARVGLRWGNEPAGVGGGICGGPRGGLGEKCYALSWILRCSIGFGQFAAAGKIPGIGEELQILMY